MQSAEAWSVTELQHFSDSACADEVGLHAVASLPDCDGISVVQTDTGEWCGSEDAFVGLFFGATEHVAEAPWIVAEWA